VGRKSSSQWRKVGSNKQTWGGTERVRRALPEIEEKERGGGDEKGRGYEKGFPRVRSKKNFNWDQTLGSPLERGKTGPDTTHYSRKSSAKAGRDSVKMKSIESVSFLHLKKQRSYNFSSKRGTWKEKGLYPFGMAMSPSARGGSV